MTILNYSRVNSHNMCVEHFVPALSKEKICESSPIELVVSAFRQWSLIQPRDRADLQPPLPIDNPLMIPALAAAAPPLHHAALHAAHSGGGGGHDSGDEDKWLSQV